MNALDVAILVIVLLSVVSGLWKGIVREVLSLGGVVLGILAGLLFGGNLGKGFERWIPNEAAAYAVAMILVFVLVMLATELISRIVTKLIKLVKLGFVNHLLGGAFGLVRGFLIGAVMVLALGLFLDPGHSVLAESKLVPVLGFGAEVMAGLLPEDIQATFEAQVDTLREMSGKGPRNPQI